MKPTAISSTTPCTSGIVAREDGVDDEAADARQGEDVLGDDGAADQRAELQAEHGDHRDERVLAARGRGSRATPTAPLARAVRT